MQTINQFDRRCFLEDTSSFELVEKAIRDTKAINALPPTP
jgi:hypothetical protein